MASEAQLGPRYRLHGLLPSAGVSTTYVNRRHAHLTNCHFQNPSPIYWKHRSLEVDGFNDLSCPPMAGKKKWKRTHQESRTCKPSQKAIPQ